MANSELKRSNAATFRRSPFTAYCPLLLFPAPCEREMNVERQRANGQWGLLNGQRAAGERVWFIPFPIIALPDYHIAHHPQLITHNLESPLTTIPLFPKGLPSDVRVFSRSRIDPLRHQFDRIDFMLATGVKKCCPENPTIEVGVFPSVYVWANRLTRLSARMTPFPNRHPSSLTPCLPG